jgi:AcrR family transcriptional regulator
MRERKEEILQRLMRYFSDYGLSELSLRPMAAKVGTSARLLIFHFGSKDNLIAEVLDHINAKLRASLNELLQKPAGGPRIAPIRAYWNWAVAEKNLASFKVMYELQLLAARNPKRFGKYLQRSSLEWLELVTDILPKEQRMAAWSTLYCAVFDGLFLELLATGDKKRTGAALDTFVDLATAHRDGTVPRR